MPQPRTLLTALSSSSPTWRTISRSISSSRPARNDENNYAGKYSKEEVDAYKRRRKTEWKRRQGGQFFLDNVIVTIRAGDGGDGCSAFHREKYKPYGPPSGGNGGRGGDVYILPTSELSTLASVPSKVRAENGAHGQGSWQNGKNGDPYVLKVPVGTVVRELPRDDPRRAKDAWEAEEEVLSALPRDEKIKKMREARWLHYPGAEYDNELREPFKEAEEAMFAYDRERRYEHFKRTRDKPIFMDLDKEVTVERSVDAPLGTRRQENLGYMVASGGPGGFGNPHFTSIEHRSPKFASRGLWGERITLSLELKLLADIGLVGMPNAGKSTLLRALTGGRAKTEVAGYAFTTLNPVIGIVRVAEDGTYEGSLSGQQVHDETRVEELRMKEMMENGELAHALTPNQDAAQRQDSVDFDETQYRRGHYFDVYETFRFTIADNPGLISQASEDVGLGHAFLRSIERSLALVYVVDLSAPEPWEELRVLRDELEAYQSGMSTKARMVIANKADLLVADDDPTAVEEAKEKLKNLEAYVKREMILPTGQELDVVPTSAKYSQNLTKVVRLMQSYIEEAREKPE
ncbi:GTPase [Cyathus striatus]|nr:GTPase [Cyathus striatus]